jgi:metallophosphoesterase superfamily enzyme
MDDRVRAVAGSGFAGCLEREGWWFTPEGAAVRAEERVAVVADVHLGYEWARGGAGDLLPAYSLAQTTAKLDRLLARMPLDRLIVAGDLLESSAPCARTRHDREGFERWLAEREVRLERLAGNHDPGASTSAMIAGWTIGHGHQALSGDRRIIGHHHPVLRGAPCFLVGPALIVLPAFSFNAAGLDVARKSLPRDLRDHSLHGLASTERELLDFGLVERIAKALKKMP